MDARQAPPAPGLLPNALEEIFPARGSNAPIYQNAKDAMARRSRTSFSISPEPGHHESFRASVELRCRENSPRKARNARRNRAWAGLRARLKFGRTPRRGGLRTRVEKHSAADWLPAKSPFGYTSVKSVSPQRARRIQTPRRLCGRACC